MSRIFFFDVDTQHDFMDPDGTLYVPGAAKIVPNLQTLTRFADTCGIRIVSSMDKHIRRDPEFKVFPPHCIRRSFGSGKIPQTIARKTRQVFIPKRTYDVFSNPRTAKVISGFDAAFVYGVALDYCVKATCLGLVSRRITAYLVTDATKAVARSTGARARALLKRNGVRFITTRQLIRRLTPCRKKSDS